MELDIKHNQCASTKRTLKTKNTYAYGKFAQNSCKTTSYIFYANKHFFTGKSK